MGIILIISLNKYFYKLLKNINVLLLFLELRNIITSLNIDLYDSVK